MWPDSMDCIHSEECECCMFRPKIAKVEHGMGKCGQNILDCYLFGFDLNFSSDTFTVASFFMST